MENKRRFHSAELCRSKSRLSPLRLHNHYALETKCVQFQTDNLNSNKLTSSHTRSVRRIKRDRSALIRKRPAYARQPLDDAQPALVLFSLECVRPFRCRPLFKQTRREVYKRNKIDVFIPHCDK